MYSLILMVILTILYYPTYLLFKVFNKKLSWNISALISTYILMLILVPLIYFLPSFLGLLPLTGYQNAPDIVLFILYLIGQFLLYALIVTVFAQLFIFLGSYLMNKFKFKLGLFNVLLTMFIISVILISLGTIFPWIPGGILTMIWF